MSGEKKDLPRVVTIELKFDLLAHHLDVEGKLPNAECAIMICDYGKKFFERMLAEYEAEQEVNRIQELALREQLATTGIRQ